MKKNRHCRRHIKLTLGRIIFWAAIALIATCSYKMKACRQENEAAGHTMQPTKDWDASGLMSVVTNKSVDEIKLHYKAMEISFNPRMHQPNWVAWELTGEETNGGIKRHNQFYNDESVTGCAETYDYLYSGYDRGHMAPAGDMKWDAQAMKETFSLVNICPQTKALNTGAWKKLEEKCRSVARLDSAVIIICGPVLTDSLHDYIGDNRVAVPRRFFKVVLSPFTNPMRGIGFIMPNDRVKGGLQSSATTIDEIERITGHDFFAALPDEIENKVESQCDFNEWSNRR